MILMDTEEMDAMDAPLTKLFQTLVIAGIITGSIYVLFSFDS